MEKVKITVPKVWRSEVGLLAAFIFFGTAAYFLTIRHPGSVITGDIIKLESFQLSLTLPLYWLMPFFVLILGVARVYNVKYVIDSRGLEAKVGILSLNQRITRILYNDIRSAETDQTLLQRVLNIGDVEVGTAATAEIEIVFSGISAPQEVQNIIQRERDRALQVNR